jgi:NAD(P)-dependent dehydrogenase (short-subunit alcohol dehydrogenase family)
VYASTKFAVEGLSEALAAELAPLGIRVTIIEPGYFRTDFLDSSSLVTSEASIADYADGPAGAMRTRAASVNHAQPGDPAKAAAALLAIAAEPEPPVRLQLGTDSVGAVEAKLGRVAAEIARWRDLSVSTDHDD